MRNERKDGAGRDACFSSKQSIILTGWKNLPRQNANGIDNVPRGNTKSIEQFVRFSGMGHTIHGKFLKMRGRCSSFRESRNDGLA